MSPFKRLAVSAGAVLVFACAASAGTLLTQGFENVGGLTAAGWAIVNNSTPGGETAWYQGVATDFPSHAGSDPSYVAANFLNAPFSGGAISDWLITPQLTFADIITVTFYTRTAPGSTYNDHLELRLSTSGASTNVGSTTTSLGDFATLILSVNPTSISSGYPDDWAQFTATLSFSAPASGRLAFRYAVSDSNLADIVGIDTLSVSQIPEPATAGLMLFGGIAIAIGRYRRSRR